MSPFIAELSSHDSNSRGKRFSHFQAFADCGVAVSLQVPTGRVPISRLRATRHWEMVVNGVVKDERSSLRLPGLQMLMFEFICSLEELENIGLVRKRGAQDTNVSTKKKRTNLRSINSPGDCLRSATICSCVCKRALASCAPARPSAQCR